RRPAGRAVSKSSQLLCTPGVTKIYKLWEQNETQTLHSLLLVEIQGTLHKEERKKTYPIRTRPAVCFRLAQEIGTTSPVQMNLTWDLVGGGEQLNHLQHSERYQNNLISSPYLFSHLVPEVPASQRHLLPELQVAPFSHGGSHTGSAHVLPVALRGHSHWSGPTQAPPFTQAKRHETVTQTKGNCFNGTSLFYPCKWCRFEL
ncbi:hypothetical protein C0J52_27293, partial [Blattella germanica]